MSGFILEQVYKVFSAVFEQKYNTLLSGGHHEPFYLAPKNGKPAEIHFTQDYVRSALHEISHWCVAGVERRKLDDFGYWYRPDGRNNSEQAEFFKFEVKPQALELAFASKLNIPFEVSCDNLSGVAPTEIANFDRRVREQLQLYTSTGFPLRAKMFLDGIDLGL